MANTKAYRHSKAKRRNLPTHETASLMDGKDTAPVHHRPESRPGSGEVRLHWGRDDAALGAETPATPLFIQEKIHPGAFANSLMQDADNRQRGLFEEFNNLPEGAAYEWYQYDGNWSNRLIKGPSVEVMASLLAKEDMAGKVQMVYFDPPYGINYKANVQVRTDRRDADGIPLDEGQITAFCDTYKSGIHSYLDTIQRVTAHARELLADSGSLFLQIGAENVHRLAIVLDEVFGAENRVATIMFKKSGATSANTLPEVGDFLLWYAKDRSLVKFRQLYEPLTRRQKVEHMSSYAMAELADGTKRQLTKDEREDPDLHLPSGARLYRRMRLASPGISKDRSGPFVWEGNEYPCPPGEQWRVSPEGMSHLAELGRLDAASEQGMLGWKRYEEEVPGRRINNFWDATMSPNDLHYVVETAESVIERCILMATDPGDLILDPTCGSGTTAYVAEKWGRRWITVDTGTLAVTLARQRLACAVFDYFLLLDSREGAEEEARLSGKPLSKEQQFNEDPSAGFVYERCPAVSASILAYDVDEPPTLLVNRPVKKPSVKRISSAFTVESHAPFKILNPERDVLGEAELPVNVECNVVAALDGATVAINGNADSLEDVQPNPYSHAKLVTHIAKHGERDVGVAIVPPEVPVGSHLIDKAAIELGRQTSEIDVLCIVAFSYDSEQMGTGGEEQRGRIHVLKFQADQNLRIGELDRSRSTADRTAGLQLLGEPEVRLLQVDDENDQYIVEITGFTTYDPATGETRPGSDRQVACWMLDTDHDSLQFRADRLHFPNGGKDRQVVRYRKALGRHIAPDKWESVLSCRSAPFPKPKSGTVAIRLVTTSCMELFCERSIDDSA